MTGRERVLRWTAIAIAALALVDPGPTLSGHARPRVSVTTSGGGEAATTVRRTIRDALNGDFEIVDGLDHSAKAIVVIGDRYPDQTFPEHSNVSTVTLGDGDRPHVTIRRVVGPRVVPAATTVHLGVDVSAAGRRGATTELTVHASGAQLARRTHKWTSDIETWHEDIDVVPVGEGPFVFDVGADDSHASVAVDSATRLRVLVVESRPSWASAFVRRALEADPRFAVSGVSAPSPGKLITSGDYPALPEDLRRLDAIVLGGLDRITHAALTTVERFVRERGGALVLLPDGTIPATLAERFIPRVTFHETLLERPAALDSTMPLKLQSSELLEAGDVPPGSDVIARSPSSRRPVIWASPFGDGRVVVSGALDAWRYRAVGDREFERFWQSLISGAALSARPAIEVDVWPQQAEPGERVRVAARVRSLERDEMGDHLAVDAHLDGDEPIRLWPDALPGTFVGAFVAHARGRDATRRVTASLEDGASGSAPLVIASPVKTPPPADPPLSRLAMTHGGVNVSPSTVAQLEQHLRRTITPDTVAAIHHPMRSPWWFIPFGGCLSAEWWLRRRRGAR